MTRSIFIYWKTTPELAPAAVAGVARLQRGLRARQPELVARLYRRADETGAMVTLMESYALAGGIGTALQQALVAAGREAVADWCQGERHVEIFDELAPAAASGDGSD